MKDEQITLTPVVRITGPEDTDSTCGGCGVETHRIEGLPQFYIMETNEPLCSRCTREAGGAGLGVMIDAFILIREYLSERKSLIADATGLLDALEKLRSNFAREFEKESTRAREQSVIENEEEENGHIN